MGKIRIEVATPNRGFLNQLYNHSFKNIEFINNQVSTEITGEGHPFLRRVYFSKFFDLLGIILVKRADSQYEALISYNRFLKTKKPYYIICENPTALYHYRLERKKGLIARFLIKNRMEDPHLRGIICISDACYKTFNELIGVKTNKVHQIYPLISDQYFQNVRGKKQRLKCLFISSTFELKSGYEIIIAAMRLPQVDFELITRIKKISKETKKKIESLNNVHLVEFNLSKDELGKKYEDADLLLHPSRQDSFGLVVLEAMKYGLPVLATDIYAFPEMVIEGINGYMVTPRYLFFDRNNKPNPEVWSNREDTIYSKYIDDNIINFLVEKIGFLDRNREVLAKLSREAKNIADTTFGESIISEKWEKIINETLFE
jgi:glycosyltransferase involved in cell wall biosynthesis